MQIRKYGIVLSSLEAADLELVRGWRNAGHVRPYMQYQEHITPDMQQRWFEKLDKDRNLYFMILQKEKKIGVIHLKDIDREAGTAEAGIFIGDTAYLNSLPPVAATIALMEFAFDTLQLSGLKAKINNSNAKVILFNLGLGYEKAAVQDNSVFEYYTVTRQDFYAATEGMRQTLAKLGDQPNS